MSEFTRTTPESLPPVSMPYQLKHPETAELLQEYLDDPSVRYHLQFLLEHHPDSFDHCIRVGGLSIDLALDGTFSHEEIRIIGTGGALHDLGKCDIAEELLSSPSILSPEERRVIQTHTRAGFDRLLHDPAFDDIRNIVVAHHELKKNPYPRAGVDRRESSRESSERREREELVKKYTSFVAVADMMDALACARSYKQALPNDQVERILREQFTGDPALIDAAMTRLSSLV